MKLSICITTKNRSILDTKKGKLVILPRVIDSIINSVEKDEIELVISDWGSTDWPIRSWIYDKVQDKFPVKVINVEEEWFSRGRGLNIAAENSESDILFFSDADIMFCRPVILDAYEKCKKNLAFFPICRHGNNMNSNVRSHRYIGTGFGLCAVTKTMWKEAEKWQEWSSWGGEDNVFKSRLIKKGYKMYRDKYPDFIHIDHPRDYNVYKNRKVRTDYDQYVKEHKEKNRLKEAVEEKQNKKKRLRQEKRKNRSKKAKQRKRKIK